MLEKTLQMIADVKPGTYVPDSTPCYDEQEVAELGAILMRLIYAPSQIRRRLQDIGVSLVPANFYSEVPLVRDLEASFQTDRVSGFEGIFDPAHLLDVLTELVPFGAEFTPPREAPPEGGFHWGNEMFSYSDAMSYYCMIRHHKPKTIVEVGSGFSTLVASAAVARNGFGEIICVEPYPPDFLAAVPNVVELVQSPVQSLGPEFFNMRLLDGSFFFIDSTHTVKHDSDCVHLICKILPSLTANIHVHLHDVTFPDTFALAPARDLQVHWTEQYLLYAYLTDNRRTKVAFGSAYNYRYHRETLERMMHGSFGSGGGSIWFSQTGR